MVLRAKGWLYPCGRARARPFAQSDLRTLLLSSMTMIPTYVFQQSLKDRFCLVSAVEIVCPSCF
jgi:hypothetical protein